MEYRSSHYPCNDKVYFFLQNMVVVYHIMFYTSKIYSIPKQQTLDKMAYP